jgi:phage shock protein A
MDQRMDAMQTHFDDNFDGLNSELTELRTHIQDTVHDPIMTRMNNMQQSFQDNMGALSNQFDNLSTNESIQDIRQRQQQLQHDFG